MSANHESLIYTCYGGLSNTGLIAGLAALEAVKQVGLRKAGISCLASLACDDKPAHNKSQSAKAIITVDGCPKECSRRLVEEAGYTPTASITVTGDTDISKISLAKDLADKPKPVMEYIAPGDIEKVTELIVDAIEENT